MEKKPNTLGQGVFPWPWICSKSLCPSAGLWVMVIKICSGLVFTILSWWLRLSLKLTFLSYTHGDLNLIILSENDWVVLVEEGLWPLLIWATSYSVHYSFAVSQSLLRPLLDVTAIGSLGCRYTMISQKKCWNCRTVIVELYLWSLVLILGPLRETGFFEFVNRLARDLDSE